MSKSVRQRLLTDKVSVEIGMKVRYAHCVLEFVHEKIPNKCFGCYFADESLRCKYICLGKGGIFRTVSKEKYETENPIHYQLIRRVDVNGNII